MNYKETTEYLFTRTPVFEKVGATAYKPGLQTTHALDEHFGHPHQYFKTIHVAGTNGKGSCSHTIAAILQAQGYKVGLYTSPHLVDFRERIRINGECIPEQYVVDFVEEERSFFEPLHPSFFELTTALAFKYFKEQQVDYAVIEVGLGGRLDCTNIITPILSIITNISYDHTQLLGDTLEKIAFEKAGIIKEDVPVVIGTTTTETRPVFETIGKERKAPVIFSEESAFSNDTVATTAEGRHVLGTHTFGPPGNLSGRKCKNHTLRHIYPARQRHRRQRSHPKRICQRMRDDRTARTLGKTERQTSCHLRYRTQRGWMEISKPTDRKTTMHTPTYRLRNGGRQRCVKCTGVAS